MNNALFFEQCSPDYLPMLQRWVEIIVTHGEAELEDHLDYILTPRNDTTHNPDTQGFSSDSKAMAWREISSQDRMNALSDHIQEQQQRREAHNEQIRQWSKVLFGVLMTVAMLWVLWRRAKRSKAKAGHS